MLRKTLAAFNQLFRTPVGQSEIQAKLFANLKCVLHLKWSPQKNRSATVSIKWVGWKNIAHFFLTQKVIIFDQFNPSPNNIRTKTMKKFTISRAARRPRWLILCASSDCSKSLRACFIYVFYKKKWCTSSIFIIHIQAPKIRNKIKHTIEYKNIFSNE